jgi:hypothetical protein
MPVRSFIIAVLTLLACASAQAAEVTVQAIVTRGELSTIFPASSVQLPPANLDAGGDQIVYVDLPFQVQDTRGNGSGWALTVTSGGFWQSLAPMPGTSASFVSATMDCAGQGLCTLPQSTVAYPVAVPSLAAPVTFLNADTGSGMGSTDLSARMAVTVPGNSLAGDFETTLTLTQAAGP